MPEGEVLTSTEAIKYLKISRITLFRLIKIGKLKAVKVGHNYRILKEDLERFIRGEE